MASPYDLLTRKSPVHDAARFQRIVKEEAITGIVIGLPIHMTGEEGTMAKEARDYGAWLGQLTQLPVTYYDERCTSAAAESLLWDAGLTHKQRKDRRDKLAAMLMLQSYIDAGCPTV
jgi:putative Holliday junction resolvase